MRLRQLLLDGFGLTSPTTDRDDLLAKLSTSVSNALVGSAFDFAVNDRPTDIVKVQPVMRLESLPRHGQAFYAFETSVYNRAEPTSYTDINVKAFLSDFDDLTNSADYHNVRTYVDISKRLDQLRKLLKSGAAQISVAYRDGLSQHATVAEVQAAIDIGERARRALVKALPDVDQTKLTISAAKAAVEDNLVKPYTAAVQYGFAKMLKNPQSDDEHQLVANFISEALDAFAAKMPRRRYDVICYPQSKGKFNATCAELVAAALGQRAIEVQKLPKREVTVNRNCLYELGLILADKSYTKTRRYERSYTEMGKTAKTTKRFKTREDYATNYMQIEAAKIEVIIARGNQDVPLNIKDIPYHDKRHCIHMFNAPTDVAGKSVLVIDDNIVSGGTTAILIGDLNRVGARVVDAFVPLRIPRTR